MPHRKQRLQALISTLYTAVSLIFVSFFVLEDDGFYFTFMGLFFTFLQPPFIMEKWCTGIVEDMKIDCTVRFEVSCQREKEREKKNYVKITLRWIPFIKGLSLSFPFFILQTMTCFWPWKFFTILQRWRFFNFEIFIQFLDCDFFPHFFKVVSEEAEKHQVHPQPWPQCHDLGTEDRDLGPSADQSRTDGHIPRSHPRSSDPDHASPSSTTNLRLTATGRLAEKGVSEYPGAKRTGSERWDDLHEFL